MATKIEVLSISHKAADLALYYPIAVPLTEAVDQSRNPAGQGLSAGELLALKGGSLHELLATVSLKSLSALEVQSKIEEVWAEREDEAAQDYEKKYRDLAYIGKTWDGSVWS